MARNRDVRLGVVLAVLALPGLLFGVSASSTPETGETISPDNSLICHTSNSSECYPKVFRATSEFQKVHDDQDLPPGLHVRLNVWTGDKEAKLYDPDEKNPDLEGLPADKAVVVVDTETAETAETAPLPSGAPQYDPAGLVKKPTDESVAFHDALGVLKAAVPARGVFFFGGPDDTRFDDALGDLKELSHDIYYGLKIAEDEESLRSLLCLMSTKDVLSEDRDDKLVRRAQQGAAVLAAAIQNNPTALRAVEESWDRLMDSACFSGGKEVSLGNLVFGSFHGEESCLGDALRGPGPAWTGSRVFAINGLIKSEKIKQEFLSKDGMAEILRLLLVESPAYQAAQTKAANLVVDNFLDEDMGAGLGAWPNKKAAASAECGGSACTATEECWDYHMERLAKSHPAEDHWSEDIWRRLSLRRQETTGETRAHDEL